MALNFVSRQSSLVAVRGTVSRALGLTSARCYSDDKSMSKGKTPIGRLDDKWQSSKGEKMEPQASEKSSDDPYAPFPNDRNPVTGEIGGPRGPEPTRYGDWERKGRVIDF